MKKISVIIPTLNEEKLIGGLLARFSDERLREKYNFEVIVTDGGSKDATLDIAKKHADKIVRHEEKRRQLIAEGRNRGAEAAKGEILIFLNADVRLGNVSQLFDAALEFAESPYIAMTCPVKVFPEEEIIPDKIFLGFYNLYFGFLNLIGLGMGRGECQVVRRNDFFEIGGYDETLVAGEDFDLFKRLRRKGRIFYAKRCVVYESPRRYRKHGHWRVFFSWLANALGVIFLRKSVSKQWEEIR